MKKRKEKKRNERYVHPNIVLNHVLHFGFPFLPLNKYPFFCSSTAMVVVTSRAE